MIYSESRATIERLIGDDSIEIIAEVYKDDGRLVAGLFMQKARRK